MKIKFKRKTILLSVLLIIGLVVLGSVSFTVISYFKFSVTRSPLDHGAVIRSPHNEWIEKKREKNKKDLNQIKTVLTPDNDFIKIARDSTGSHEKKHHKESKADFDTIIYTVVEEMPCFPGGEEARIRFLEENISYPEQAKEQGFQGKVYITFVVEVDGSISDVRVIRGIGGGCDEEAVRVIKLMPKWNPGKAKGFPVRVKFNLPIKFTLQ